MLIKCPKCNSVYDLPDNLIKDAGLAMRCAECGEIWTPYPEDSLKKNIKGPSQNINKIFERVSKETENLFNEPEVRTVEKIKVVNVTRYKHTVNFILLFVALFSILAALYYMRYDIVRIFPRAENFYDKIQIESIPYGRNLEFKDVATREFTKDNIAKIEINGSIANTGKYVTNIPPIKVDIYDKQGNVLLNTTHYLPILRLEPGYNLLFNIVVTNPSPYGKSIYLNFNEKL